MCTAMTYQSRDFYFGRTLDYDFSFGETVTVTPRRFPFSFRHGTMLRRHHAILGMAHVSDGYPLYYDAINEAGLCMAGLNFVGNAVYQTARGEGEEVAQFELIPWVLSQFDTVAQAKQALSRVRIVDTPFNKALPTAQLHWMIADSAACITVESTAGGLRVHDNPLGVLTNNPPFEHQLAHWERFAALTNEEPNTSTDPTFFSRGTGAVGLPGDLSSPSRFVRAAFTRRFATSDEGEKESVTQFFHMLGTVAQTKGCCKLGDGRYEITLYTSCCNAARGIYYYTTYQTPRIHAVDMHRVNLDGTHVIAYPLMQDAAICFQN